MGSILSKSTQIHPPVNYDCPVCEKTGKLPNISGRFFLVENTDECECNGCHTRFPKSQFYKTMENT